MILTTMLFFLTVSIVTAIMAKTALTRAVYFKLSIDVAALILLGSSPSTESNIMRIGTIILLCLGLVFSFLFLIFPRLASGKE